MSSSTDQSAPATPYAYADVRHIVRPPSAAREHPVRAAAPVREAAPKPLPRLESPRRVTHPATPYQQPVFEVTGPAAVPAALLELARADATAAGYSAGWAQGVSEAREQMAAQVAASRDRAHEFDMERAEALHKALHALDFAAAELEQRAVRSAEQSEDVLLDMAVEIAEALLQRDLRMGDTGSDALARVLALAPVDEPITVRLSPADHAAVTADGMSPQSDSRREIVLVADPELQPGDAMAISGASLIDGRLREGLARVRAVLSR